jgi:hypothetical protein
MTGGSRDRLIDGQVMSGGVLGTRQKCHHMFKYYGTLRVSVRSIFAESPGFIKAGPGA